MKCTNVRRYSRQRATATATTAWMIRRRSAQRGNHVGPRSDRRPRGLLAFRRATRKLSTRNRYPAIVVATADARCIMPVSVPAQTQIQIPFWIPVTRVYWCRRNPGTGNNSINGNCRRTQQRRINVQSASVRSFIRCHVAKRSRDERFYDVDVSRTTSSTWYSLRRDKLTWIDREHCRQSAGKYVRKLNNVHPHWSGECPDKISCDVMRVRNQARKSKTSQRHHLRLSDGLRRFRIIHDRRPYQRSCMPRGRRLNWTRMVRERERLLAGKHRSTEEFDGGKCRCRSAARIPYVNQQLL